MKAIVRIHSTRPPHRTILDLPAAFDVDRALTATGRGQFAFTIPAAAIQLGGRDRVGFGDLVVIESTVLGVRPYVGVITKIGESGGAGAIDIEGDNYASILYGLALDRSASFGGGSAGAIAGQLLRLAQGNGRSVFVEDGSLFGDAVIGGATRLEFGSQTLGRALDALADRFDNEWWITHSVRRARVRHWLHFGVRRGDDRSRSVMLEEGRDFVKVEYERDALGQIRSAIMIGGGGAVEAREGVAVSSTPGALATSASRVEDASLIGRPTSPLAERDVYEYRPNDTDPAILANVARRRFMRPTTANESLSAIAALSRCGAFRPGDTIGVRFHSVRGSGSTRLVRVLGMQPDEQNGQCDLVVQV